MGARHCKLFLTVSEKIFVVVWGAEVCAQVYHELFSFARLKNLTVQKTMSITSIDQIFHSTLSSEPYSQLLFLCDKLDGLNLNSDIDTWSYILD